MAEDKLFKVEIARPAMVRYHELILPYIHSNYNFDRASAIDNGVVSSIQSLSKQPLRGSREKYLTDAGADFRFILYRITKHFELKIIYYVDEGNLTVYVTDIFPTKMNPDRISKN